MKDRDLLKVDEIQHNDGSKIADIEAQGMDQLGAVLDKHKSFAEELKKSKEELKKSKEEVKKSKEEVKKLEEKLEGHERNVIATMGILFSLFIGISSSLSLFSFAKETPLSRATLIILGVIITNITLAIIFVYMIKILFTHKTEEPHTIKIIEKPTKFFWSITFFLLSIIVCIIGIIIAVLLIRWFEVWLTSYRP